MTLKRQTPGECEWKLSVFRDGERMQSDDASFQLTQFCTGWNIVEDFKFVKTINQIFNRI